jgi:hypothetical protein
MMLTSHMRILFLAALSAAMLAGCQSKPPAGSQVVKPGDTSLPEFTTPGSGSTDTEPPPKSGGTKASPRDPNASNDPETGPGPKISAPSPNKTIDKPGTASWIKTSLTVGEIATKVGQTLLTLENAYGDGRVGIKTPAGSGVVVTEYYFGTGKQIRCSFVVPNEVPTAGSVISNGDQKIVVSSSGTKGPMPASESDPVSDTVKGSILANWPRHFSRALVMGRTDGWDPWKPFADQLADAKSEFHTTVEERTSEFRGHKILNYRILATRKPEFAKKHGKTEIEIVVDALHWLPVTINTRVTEPNGATWNQAWTTRWKFRQDHEPRVFELEATIPGSEGSRKQPS